MPGGDRTGPDGQGPMTGWGNGYCARRVSDTFTVTEAAPDRRGRMPGPGLLRRNRRFVSGEVGRSFACEPRGWGCGRGFRGGRFR